MKYEFSENIQRGILYLLKSDDNFYVELVNLIKPDYFEFPSHAKLFEIINGHRDKYLTLPNDEIILEEARQSLSSREDLSDYEDELTYINSLDTSCVENPSYLIDLVEDFAKKSAMKEAIKASMLLLKDDKIGDIEPLVRKALTVSRNIDVGQSYFPSIKERWLRILSEDFSDRFGTILPSLNRCLDGGLSLGELGMVVAPPGVGKSMFLVNQAVQSLSEGRKVLYISLEMSEDKIAQRFDSVLTKIPQSRLKTNQSALSQRLEKVREAIPNSDLVIKQFPTGLATVNTVRSLLVQLKNYDDFVPDLLIVDYLELMRPTNEGMHEYQAQQRISEELRGLAVENKCLLWTATQTNRQGRAVKVITDSELADAYGKIRTCDFAVSLNQTEEEFDSGRMRCYVMKSRNSNQRFIIPMTVDYSILHMSENTDEDYEDDE